MKTRGCRFSLEDFGTGMSSFANLKNLQVKFIKIDGSFVRDMVNDEIDAAMVDAIKRLATQRVRTLDQFDQDSGAG